MPSGGGYQQPAPWAVALTGEAGTKPPQRRLVRDGLAQSPGHPLLHLSQNTAGPETLNELQNILRNVYGSRPLVPRRAQKDHLVTSGFGVDFRA
jgi:hypothetical protein